MASESFIEVKSIQATRLYQRESPECVPLHPQLVGAYRQYGRPIAVTGIILLLNRHPISSPHYLYIVGTVQTHVVPGRKLAQGWVQADDRPTLDPPSPNLESSSW